MKILIGHCFYRSTAPSGEDSVYRNEKELLIANGLEVICYEKQNDELNTHGFIQKALDGINYIWSKQAYEEISQLIKQHKPDIAHFHNIFPQMSTSVYQACKDHGIPVVQTLHNFRNICPAGLLQRNQKPCEDCISGSLLHSIKNKCYRNSSIATIPMAAMIKFNQLTSTFSNNVDQYIALTEFAKSRFIKAGFPNDKFTIKPNFVTSDSQPKNILGDYILFVGRLTQEKGIQSLIEACKQFKHIPLKVVGDGELRISLESIVSRNGLNVEFLGYKSKSEVRSLMDYSRFVVIPSECYEGFPVTICEAYACGKSVIASKIGSLDELIEENITGKKFIPSNTYSMAEAIKTAWANHDLTLKMGMNCRNQYLKSFSPELNYRQLSDIYQKLSRSIDAK